MTFPTWSVGEVLTAADMNKIGQYVSYPRNLLYNGAMQIAQRNSSLGSITTPGFYTADRWRTDLSTLGTWTNSIENDAPTGSGFRKSAKWLCTTADASPASSDLLAIQQLLEGQDLQSICKGTSSAQQITMSFWVKSNVTGTYVFEMYDVDNTRQVSKSYTISAAGTWEFKTITIPADTTGAFDNDNGLSLYVIWWLGAGSTFTSGTLNTSWASVTNANRAVGQVNVAAAINNYWQITGVQLNVGQYAEPFEFKTFGQELAECQRYYYRIDGIFGNFCTMSNGGITTSATNLGRTGNHLPVAMRTTSVSTADVSYSGLVGYDGSILPAISSVGLANNTRTTLSFDWVCSTGGLTTFRPAQVFSNTSTSGNFLAISAELA